MNIYWIPVIIILLLIFIFVQIIAIITAYKIATPKQYKIKQILDEDIKGTKKLFDLKKYIETEPLYIEEIKLINLRLKYEIWGTSNNTKFVILIHGVANTKERMYKYAKIWNDFGYNAVVFDGKGWGDNNKMGRCTYGDIESDIVQQIKIDLESKYTVSYIGIHGESMGAATTYNWVKKYSKTSKVNFIVTEAGYFNFNKPIIVGMKGSSIPKIFAFIILPFIMIWLLLIFRINIFNVKITNRHLKTFKMPIMIIQSKTDKVVPYSEFKHITKQLKKTNTNFETYIVEDVKHARTLLSEKHQEDWIKKLEKFIKGVENGYKIF